jgi:hypothetical protein
MTDWKPCCRLLAVVAAPAAGRSACSCSASRASAVVSRFFRNTNPTLMGFLAPEGLGPRTPVLRYLSTKPRRSRSL